MVNTVAHFTTISIHNVRTYKRGSSNIIFEGRIIETWYHYYQDREGTSMSIKKKGEGEEKKEGRNVLGGRDDRV